MIPSFDLPWLKEKINNGESVEYLFFWGHTNKGNQAAGPFCLSQWSESPFMVGTINYKTAEHWMMAQKAHVFHDDESFYQIINAETPEEAKALGRQVKSYHQPTWDDVKYDLVRFGNLHKFSQHPALAEYLLGTGDQILVEASPVDTIWGIGMAQDDEDIEDVSAWRGQNLLGFALMEVREFLKEHGPVEPTFQNDLYPRWEELVTVITFPFAYEVSVVSGHLELEGIECFIKDKLTAEVVPLYTSALGGVKLQVKASDQMRAVEILTECGYLKEEEVFQLPFYARFDKVTSSIPIFKHLPTELRLMVVFVVIVLVAATLYHYLVDESHRIFKIDYDMQHY